MVGGRRARVKAAKHAVSAARTLSARAGAGTAVRSTSLPWRKTVISTGFADAVGGQQAMEMVDAGQRLRRRMVSMRSPEIKPAACPPGRRFLP